MNASNPRKIKEKATKAQWKKTAETRDCPSACGGHLERVDLWMHDDMLGEKYAHKGGSGDCDCDDGGDGLVGSMSAKIAALHYRNGRSEGRGCLEGEL